MSHMLKLDGSNRESLFGVRGNTIQIRSMILAVMYGVILWVAREMKREGFYTLP